MNEAETRILQMKQYIMYCFSSKDFAAIHEFMKRDGFSAIELAFLYGEAKGYRKAKAVIKDA